MSTHSPNFESHMDLPHLSLAACILIATYALYRSMRAPNPRPAQPQAGDPMNIAAVPLLMGMHRLATVLAGLLRAIYTLFRPVGPSVLCPAPQTLDSALFAWSPYVLFFAGTSIAGGIVRILAYAHLGRNFTFELACPDRLVRSGVYRYLQHPSYTGVILTCLGLASGPSEPGAGVGCFAPALLLPYLASLRVVYLALLFLGLVAFLPLRIRDEERMMKRAFGREWEDWHRGTSRLIPGVF